MLSPSLERPSRFYDTARQKRHANLSLYDLKSSPMTDMVKTAKLRSEMFKGYNNKVREIVHQTDHLIDYNQTAGIIDRFENTNRALVAGRFYPSHRHTHQNTSTNGTTNAIRASEVDELPTTDGFCTSEIDIEFSNLDSVDEESSPQELEGDLEEDVENA